MAAYATPDGTRRYAARFMASAAPGNHKPAAGYFREQLQLTFSSIGIGTYLGESDSTTDQRYADSVVAAVQGGINVVDTAINYRFQRSERSIGAALEKLSAGGIGREEIVLCTKAGFLTPDGEMPTDPGEYFFQEYVKRGVFGPDDVAAGCHCMTPAYLADQLGRSLRNLGVACIDVFYIHNPETQLGEIPREQFRERLRASFKFCESAVAEGKIRWYGLATWNGFRQDPQAKDYISLEEVVGIASEMAGENHHLRFVQLPFNLAMPEALVRPSQTINGRPVSMVQAARPLGIVLVTSASLLQGQLTRNLPPYIAAALGLKNDRERALQFARSVPGITTALVGMSQPDHVRANLAVAGVEPATREQLLKLFEQHR
jgi:aryl-alcohol dehydrogenase-like predicted oxidoreductase